MPSEQSTVTVAQVVAVLGDYVVTTRTAQPRRVLPGEIASRLLMEGAPGEGVVIPPDMMGAIAVPAQRFSAALPADLDCLGCGAAAGEACQGIPYGMFGRKRRYCPDREAL